ncbi:hypothetical protein PYJP_05440 [Pyrofollis japonicus]|uniref:hypothetical protein n=1 Tax=Pyrofollis japonicus TaxID=3060460 RepID=UPI00295B38BD|nr:hypothetical protein [Pyrofollis japonicus]BEP17192.1 hypothetical protein PYJP_05440 [Pyrofollis japonicus]
MPKTTRYQDKEFIIGPGLDELLEPDTNIILLDPDFAEMYGDYIFLGYNTYSEQIHADRADLVGLYTAYILLSKGKSVVVCGKSPIFCTPVLAAYILIEKDVEPLSALKEAWKTLQPLYESTSTRVSAQIYSALSALRRVVNILGKEVFTTIFSLASNYEYGYGRLSYGETITWTNNLRGSDDAISAAALSFLALSLHGAPAEILRYRLEAVGESSLLSLLGPRAERILAILRRLASENLDEDSALLRLVISLGPGTESVNHVNLDDSKLIVYCTGEEPTKECMTKVSEADKVLQKGIIRIASIKVVPGKPEPILISA